MVRRLQSDPLLPGYFEIPGGKVEQGEDVLAAAVRECFEEIGQYPIEIQALVSSFDYQVSLGTCRQFNFVASIASPIRLAVDEHDMLVWVRTASDMEGLQMSDEMKGVVQQYLDSSFSINE
jgi:8-oxo-dGTP diphosphatase